MKLSATHAFNCIVLMVKFGWTSCEDIPPALCRKCPNIGMVNCLAQSMLAKNHHNLTGNIIPLANQMEFISLCKLTQHTYTHNHNQ